MVRKQKTKSYLPSFKERHSPGYNWNGPGTSIPQRISLTYKGSVGSESYFLPVNKLDLSAFQHDLLYYSPDSVTRTFADWEYLKYINGNFKPSTPVYLMSKLLIFSQISKRILYQGASIGALAFMTKKKFMNSLEYFKKVFTTPPVQGFGSLGGYLLNPVKGVAPQSVKDIMRFYFNIQGTRGGNLAKFRKDFYFKFLPLLVMYGASPLTKPVTDVKKMLDIILVGYGKTEEWSDFKAENDKVFNKYQDYLKSVGGFDKDDNFVINHTINNELAQEKYKEFFKEYQSYLGHVNKKYIQTPGFESYKIPKLNTENLDIVSLPITSEPPSYKLSDAEKQNIKNMIDPDKVFEKYKNVNEYNEDIVNILKNRYSEYNEFNPFPPDFDLRDGVAKVKPDKDIINMLKNIYTEYNEFDLRDKDENVKPDEDIINVLKNRYSEYNEFNPFPPDFDLRDGVAKVKPDKDIINMLKNIYTEYN